MTAEGDKPMFRLCRTLIVILSAAVASMVAGQPPVQRTSSHQPLPRPAPVNHDELFLNGAGIGTEPAALCDLLRNHSRTDADTRLLDKLVRQLGDEDFDRREQAERAITAMGRPALDRLAQARRDADPEVSRRAALIAADIRKKLDPDAAFAAVRELIRQRVDGAAAELLAYLPYADTDTEEEIYFGIDRVAVRDGKVDPAMKAALTDNNPARRALAALTLGRLGDEANREAVRRCLTDNKSNVRLRSAQGLLAAHDNAALPTLVALLDDGSLDVAWQAEELLRWVAGAKAPEPRVGMGVAAARRKCTSAWKDWLRDNSRVDWQRVQRDHRRPGLILVCAHDGVFLIGSDGKPAWQFTGFTTLRDAQLLPNARLLLAEEADNSRVIECDLNGKILWEYKNRRGDYLSSCERLANGNTFIVSDEGLTEVTPDQRTVFDLCNEINVLDGTKPRNGSTVCLSYTKLRQIDQNSGKVVTNTLVCSDRRKLCALPDGGVLVNDFLENKVVHLDAEGACLWETALQRPTSVVGLRNGNLLASSSFRGQRIVELARTGQTVWETQMKGRIDRLRPCFNLLRVGLDHARPKDFDINDIGFRIEALKDPDRTVRGRSAEALGHLGPLAAPAVPALVAMLGDDSNLLRRTVGEALSRIGPEAVPALIAALKTGTPIVRDEAAIALGQMSGSAPTAVPQLIVLLADAKLDDEVRRASARALGLIGKVSVPAVTELLAALKADDFGLRSEAARALGKIGAEPAVVMPALIDLLRDPTHLVKLESIRSLAAFGPAAQPAVAVLVELTQQTKAEVELRQAAVDTLGAIGPKAKSAVPALAVILKDRTTPTGLRAVSAEAITRLEPTAKDALPAFRDVLRDEGTPQELTRVLVDLLATGFETPGLLMLAQVAKEAPRSVRITALQMLPTLGTIRMQPPPLPKEVIDIVKEIAEKEKDQVIRAQAARIMQRVEARKFELAPDPIP